ncbi:uncharacterized protein LOC131846336 [Achroia grisella]|uniref:uncharacterized protein LOC131846336 n=1 Tax=Achroia grisella TaxID=688607 RepID=UPI0027D23A93|nr:uncharacterized protein LOC131846336 [Achroia grisella]
MMNINTELVLRQLLDKIADEQNYKEPNISVHAITSGGANYTSILYLATISQQNKDELKLFAKVAIMSDVARSHYYLPLFDLERFAYTNLLPRYADIQDRNQISEENKLVWPKFYGCNPNLYEETIVLENLVANGFNPYDRFKSINWAYASKAVETLAKFHALSIAYGEENPTEYAQLLEKMKFDPNSVARVSGAFTKLVKMALAVTKEENRERLKAYIEKEGDLVNMAKSRQENFVGLNVLTHGGFRPSNLMHRTKADGTIEVIPVDFQTITANSPVVDLFHFIFTGSDEEFRREHYEQLVEHYYQELSRALRNLNLDPNQLYPKENYKKDIEYFLPIGLIIGLFTLPVITVESENAPSFEGKDGMNSIACTKTSNLYPERLNGIVNDYVRWGIL